jgi:hypothetical protein
MSPRGFEATGCHPRESLSAAALNLVDNATWRGHDGTYPCANDGSDGTGHQKACSSSDGSTRRLLAVRTCRNGKAHQQNYRNLLQ